MRQRAIQECERLVRFPPVGRWARVRRATADLSSESIEQVAHRVVELLRLDRTSHASGDVGLPRYLDASQLARHLGVTRVWVYEHASELGAITLGSGPRPRLRFDAEIATQAFQARRRRKPSPNAPQTKRGPGRARRREPNTTPLLPVRGSDVRRILSRSGFHVGIVVDGAAIYRASTGTHRQAWNHLRRSSTRIW